MKTVQLKSLPTRRRLQSSLTRAKSGPKKNKGVDQSAAQTIGDSDSDDPHSGKIEINMNQAVAEMSMKTGSNISHKYTYFGELVKADKLYLLYLCEKDIFTGVSLAEVGEKVPFYVLEPRIQDCPLCVCFTT